MVIKGLVLNISENFLSTERHKTFYLASGPEDGPLLIMTHGWPELSLSWRHQLKYLGVSEYEPLKALDGGVDGTEILSKVIIKSSQLLKINGKLIIEIGSNQKYKVMKILNKNNFYINKIAKDLSSNDRCIVSTKLQ